MFFPPFYFGELRFLKISFEMISEETCMTDEARRPVGKRSGYTEDFSEAV